MNVSTAEAKDRLTELIRIAEAGEPVTITRHGKPVVQLARVPAKREVAFDSMKDRIKFYPGWDDPFTEEELLGDRF